MTPLAITHAIADLAERQHGHVRHDQLIAAGLAPDDVKTRVGRGWLIPRHHEVYAVGHVPRTRAAAFCAAVLALGLEAALSHRAAGAHWEVVRGAVPLEVIVPVRGGRPNRDGIIVHTGTLPPEHVRVRDGIRVTSLLRTLLDLAAVVSLRTLRRAFEAAQVIHHLPPEPLAAEALCRRGHRGSRNLRLVLDGAVNPDGVRSILELRFLRLCASFGIPRPLVNERFGAWEADFFWPDRLLVVETDGLAFHRTPAARRRDALKDEYLRGLGLDVVRLTWSDVTERPAATAARITSSDGLRGHMPL